jgi:hypothetical protein
MPERFGKLEGALGHLLRPAARALRESVELEAAALGADAAAARKGARI